MGDEDRSLTVEDLTVPAKGTEGESGGSRPGRPWSPPRSNAAQSPPFMTPRRVVVLRDVGHLLVGEVGPLVACVGDLLDTTDLVFVAGGGTVPAALAKAWKDATAKEHRAARTKGADVLQGALEEAGVRLRPDAAQAVLDRVGGEVGRIPAIVEVLGAAYGSGRGPRRRGRRPVPG